MTETEAWLLRVVSMLRSELDCIKEQYLGEQAAAEYEWMCELADMKNLAERCRAIELRMKEGMWVVSPPAPRATEERP